MWLIFDASGLALGFLTWVFMAFADWVVVHHILLFWFRTAQPRIERLPLTDAGWLIFLLYQSLLGLSLFSHFAAMTTDPGTIKEHGARAPADYRNPKFCNICGDRWKPPRAHHCKRCHRCIFRMDHHCPWINNCIGFSNQKLFILFLSYTSLSAISTLTMIVASAGFWLWSQRSWPAGVSPLICCGIVSVECCLAGFFVGDLLLEQIESIQTNSTLVETYQRTHGRRSTPFEHFKEVFGHRWYAWPWPCVSHAPADYTERAIPEADGAVSEGENIGIAGEESEARASDLNVHQTSANMRPGVRQFQVE